MRPTMHNAEAQRIGKVPRKIQRAARPTNPSRRMAFAVHPATLTR